MIDSAGKVMIPFEYDTILYDGTQLSGDRLICVAVNGRFGYITPEGETVIAPVFDDPVGKCSGEFREGVAPVVSDGKKFFIDRSGSLAITPKEEFDCIAHFDDGRAQVLRYDRDSHGILEGFIDKSGSLAVPVQYRQIGSSYSEGVTAVWYEDRVVYISNRGDIIIRTPYTEVTDFSGGIAWGRTDGLWEGFDHDGKVISSVSDAERLIPCPDGRWVAEFKGKYRYADAKNTKTDLQYVSDCPYCLSEGEWLMLCLDKENVPH